MLVSTSCFRGTLQLQEMVHCRWVEDVTQVHRIVVPRRSIGFIEISGN